LREFEGRGFGEKREVRAPKEKEKGKEKEKEKEEEEKEKEKEEEEEEEEKKKEKQKKKKKKKTPQAEQEGAQVVWPLAPSESEQQVVPASKSRMWSVNHYAWLFEGEFGQTHALKWFDGVVQAAVDATKLKNEKHAPLCPPVHLRVKFRNIYLITDPRSISQYIIITAARAGGCSFTLSHADVRTS
jgi:hypothetical protein